MRSAKKKVLYEKSVGKVLNILSCDYNSLDINARLVTFITLLSENCVKHMKLN